MCTSNTRLLLSTREEERYTTATTTTKPDGVGPTPNGHFDILTYARVYIYLFIDAFNVRDTYAAECRVLFCILFVYAIVICTTTVFLPRNIRRVRRDGTIERFTRTTDKSEGVKTENARASQSP